LSRNFGGMNRKPTYTDRWFRYATCSGSLVARTRRIMSYSAWRSETRLWCKELKQVLAWDDGMYKRPTLLPYALFIMPPQYLPSRSSLLVPQAVHHALLTPHSPPPPPSRRTINRLTNNNHGLRPLRPTLFTRRLPLPARQGKWTRNTHYMKNTR
jgi:hypothetical protein